jgi:lactate dehydrogenase-like 2-hydroxyacid dehydrogenase
MKIVFPDRIDLGEASSAKFRELGDVVATPHLAYNTEETTARLGANYLLISSRAYVIIP